MKRITISILTTCMLASAACDDTGAASDANAWDEACDDVGDDQGFADESDTEGEEEEEESLPPVPPLKPFPGAPALEELHVEADLDADVPHVSITFVSSNDHVGEIEISGGSAAQPVQSVELRHDGDLVSRQHVDLGAVNDGSSCALPTSSFELGEFEALAGVHAAGTADLYAAAAVAAGEQQGWHTGASPTDCELNCGVIGGGVGASAAAGAVAKVCPPNTPWCIGIGAGAAVAGGIIGGQICSNVFCD